MEGVPLTILLFTNQTNLRKDFFH